MAWMPGRYKGPKIASIDAAGLAAFGRSAALGEMRWHAPGSFPPHRVVHRRRSCMHQPSPGMAGAAHFRVLGGLAAIRLCRSATADPRSCRCSMAAAAITPSRPVPLGKSSTCTRPKPHFSEQSW